MWGFSFEVCLGAYLLGMSFELIVYDRVGVQLGFTGRLPRMLLVQGYDGRRRKAAASP